MTHCPDRIPLHGAKPFRRNGLGLDHQAAGIIARSAFTQDVGTSGVVETGNEAIAVKVVEVVSTTQQEIDEAIPYIVEVVNNALREDILNMLLLSFAETHNLNLNPAAVRHILVGAQ